MSTSLRLGGNSRTALLVLATAPDGSTPFPAPLSSFGRVEAIFAVLAIVIALVAWVYRDKDEII
jgi:hypothetical protein